MEEIYASLDVFFAELKEMSAPFATKFVREEAGMVIREAGDNDTVLPPHMGKHRCYANWCYSRGWKVKKKSKALTTYKNVKDYERREHDDTWPEGTECKDVIGWSAFWNYWQKKHKDIHVRAKGEDVCTDCHILAQSL